MINHGSRSLVDNKVTGRIDERRLHMVCMGLVTSKHEVHVAGLGARDPRAAAAAIAACTEGLILPNIARHDDSDPCPTFDLVIRAALD